MPKIAYLLLAASLPAHAGYPLPEGDIIGELQHIAAGSEDTMPHIAKAFGMGLNELEIANRHTQRWTPGAGAKVALPTMHVLPEGKRKGIVINIPEMRIYYFRKGEVHTWPIGVGREGWNIPYKPGKIISRHKDPAWYPPKSIRKEHEEEGDPLPKVVPPGPDNPLGKFALRMSLPGYLIHGTNKEYGIGMRVSHGCIRMYPQDIEELYKITPTGTPFRVINEPIKLGMQGKLLYMEAHPHMIEDAEPHETTAAKVQQRISAMTKDKRVSIDWDLITKSLLQPTGVPIAIGIETTDHTTAAAPQP